MEADLKIGNKVRGPYGVGRVGHVDAKYQMVLLVHDEEVPGGHDGGEEWRVVGASDGHCRWLGFDTLSPVEEELVTVTPVLPTDPAARKAIPVVTGCLDYFSAAIAEVAKLSKVGNDQHNPGQPLHWARGKSTDHADTIVRHLIERGTVDTDGIRHSAKVAWRALALLQEELEAEGAPRSRGSR